MESTQQPKQFPVKKRQGTRSPGWGTTHFQGSSCEFLRDYTDSGLCPILIDDILGGPDLVHNGKPCSFKIIGKLGRGSYSTVWLGRETNSNQYLALKALRREYSTLDNPEMSILRKLEKLEVAFFHTHASTQDQFLCLGLKPLGCTLRERYNSEVDAPGLPSLTILVKTLLEKVVDFHQRGICHGDISANNVSLGVHSEAFTNEALHETFEYDQKSHIILRNVSGLNTPPPRPTNLPEYIIVRYGTPLKTNAQDMSLVDIIDFGKGFEAPSKSNVLGTENYCAPELNCDGANIATAKSDLWSLGCVFAYALTNKHLFKIPSDLSQYLAVDNQAQFSFIESRLSNSLRDEPEYLRLFTRLIHSLVRVNPGERNSSEAERIVKQLETWRPQN